MKRKQEDRTIEIEASVPKYCTISYYYEKDQEMPESEREHVKEMLEEGYTSGELNDSNENRGWWNLVES